MYAVPRFVLTAFQTHISMPSIKFEKREAQPGEGKRCGHSHCLFMGRSKSRICPYCPNISLRWSSLMFFVRRSTTICIELKH
jgi:hypothetical protein